MPEERKLLSDVDGAEMFAQALNEEPPSEPKPEEPPAQPEPEPEKAEPVEDATGRLHGEGGRFIPKQATADAAPTQPPPVAEEKPAPTQEAPEAVVPSGRLREERERREAAERRAMELERQFSDFQRQWMLQQQRQQQPQQPQAPEIDPLTDPQGYARMIESTFENRLARMALNQNLELARLRHGEKFDEAFDVFMQVAERDPRFGQAVVGSANPGDTLWKWYQGQLILREVGTDPAAYLTKKQEEWLNDPAMQAKVIERFNAKSQQAQPGARPSNITQLPPSLNKATGSSANTVDSMPTGAELFNHALRG